MKKRYFIILIVIVLVSGVFAHYFIDVKKTNISSIIAKKPLYWIDPMEPTHHYPGPGKSSMGMELTPIYPDDTQNNDQSILRISPSITNNLGVRTALVTKGALARRIETVGYVEPDENNISHIHSYADGWVKILIVKAAGEPVKKGQLLLQLYSPTLVNAQEEYLIALESNNQDLIDASYKKLQALNISDQQIQHVKVTRKVSQLVDIYSPQEQGKRI